MNSLLGSKVHLVVAGIALLAGSFYLTSGGGLTGVNSLLAATVSTITGRPTLMVSRSTTSPSGTIAANKNTILAEYDISAKNVTNWISLRNLSMQVVVSSQSVSPLKLSSLSMKYEYCISAGRTYGYGWKSGGCATTTIAPSSITQQNGAYVLTFNKTLSIYPQQYKGTISILGTPSYSYTGSATKKGSGNAKLQVKIVSLSGNGDKCTYGYISKGKYGYKNCYSSSAVINIQSNNGHNLTVLRPYGYGYLANKKQQI